jgi:uncharacterized protein YbjT (DUF2867 family)
MRRALVFGASGLVGRAIVAQLLDDSAYAEVHVALRRASAEPPPHPRLAAHRIDFRVLRANLDAMPLPPVDDVYCAIGTTIKMAGSRDAFRAVDFEVTLDSALAARHAGAERLALVSALGADPASSIFYNRVKGETEQALTRIGYPVFVIARPSLLAGDRAATGQPVRRGETLALRVFEPMARLLPQRLRPISAASVARALCRACVEGRPGVRVIESEELERLGRA